MDHLAAYLAACHPRPVRALGVALQPFCLGHAMLLHHVRSPFVDSVGLTSTSAQILPSVPDLLLALLICSRSYDEGAAALRSLSGRARLQSWRWQARLLGWLRPGALDAAFHAFAEYIADASAFPPHEVERANSRKPGAPWLALLKLTLMVHLGKSESQALNTPLGAAHWDYLCYWESQGGVKVQNEKDASLIEAARAEMRRLQAERAASPSSPPKSTRSPRSILPKEEGARAEGLGASQPPAQLETRNSQLETPPGRYNKAPTAQPSPPTDDPPLDFVVEALKSEPSKPGRYNQPPKFG